MTNHDLDISYIVKNIATVLLQKKWLLCSAESCTGGWLAKSCTDLSGSSSWFDGGFVTYSDQAKQNLLGVKQTVLKQYGAFSEEAVIAMAEGALQHSTANISVAITGIAGPSGATIGKPIGTVWFAWAIKDFNVTTKLHHFSGDRETIRRQAVIIALKGIIKNARDSSFSMG